MSIIRTVSACIATALLALAAPAAEASVLIKVDKSAQRMTVSVDGVERHSWPVSTGRLGHDTPSGNHRAFRMERDHFSKEWDDAPMPHSIFFTKTGHAIHGSLDVKRIGSPASAGCVRLAPENAAALFALVEEKGVLNTSVVITGDVQVALARSTQRTAARRDAEPRPPQRRPRTLTPDEDDEPRYYARRQRHADPDELDAYAARMRQRYQQERQRAQQQYPRERYFGPDGREYSVQRPYYAEPYYQRRSAPFMW